MLHSDALRQELEQYRIVSHPQHRLVSQGRLIHSRAGLRI